MLLRQQEFVTLRLEAAEEVVGAELEDVGGLCAQNLTVQGVDFVRVLEWERHLMMMMMMMMKLRLAY